MTQVLAKAYMSYSEAALISLTHNGSDCSQFQKIFETSKCHCYIWILVSMSNAWDEFKGIFRYVSFPAFAGIHTLMKSKFPALFQPVLEAFSPDFCTFFRLLRFFPFSSACILSIHSYSGFWKSLLYLEKILQNFHFGALIQQLYL